MKQLIQKLVEAAGPSGYEAPVRDLVRQEIDGLADEVWVDALGNLIARQGQRREGGKRVLLDAHLDEIGLIATHIDENGFVRFTNVGYIYPQTCLGSRVRFLNGTQGVIGGERLDDQMTLLPLEKLFIDVGASSREDCPVRIGDVASFERPFLDLGERMVAKAMDDRISVAVQVEVMRRMAQAGSPHEIIYVFSTQEEVGTRGAITAAYGADPEVGIAIDVTMTGDTPKARRMEVSLGKGPAIKVRDAGMLADPRLVRAMEAAAARLDIPYQLEILEGGTTDARSIQMTRAGVVAGCISIPCRYVHSPSEMVDVRDVENSVRLLVELLSQPMDLS